MNHVLIVINPVDKIEQMLDSSPSDKPYIKNFESQESPSGIMARSGIYGVTSRVIDDDGKAYAGLFSPIDLLVALLTAHIYSQIGIGISSWRRNGESCWLLFK